MKWIWDGGFRAHKRNEDGTVEEKLFTSVAQARQFVEQEEKVNLVTKHPPRQGKKNRQRKKGSSTSLTRLNEQQLALKQLALKQVQGL